MDTRTHTPDSTDWTTWLVWVRREHDGALQKFEGVVDVMKLPTGVVRVAFHDGVWDECDGEIFRMRQEGLDERTPTEI